MIALSLTSQISLSIIPILSIYMIVLASWIVLDAKLTKYDFWTCLFFTPGMVLIIIGSHVHQPSIKSHELGDYVFSTESIILFMVSLLILVTIGVFVYYILGSYDVIRRRIETLNFSEQSAFNQTEDSNTSRSSEPIIPQVGILSYRWGLVPMVYFPFLAALFGTLSNAVAKCLLIVYHDDIKHHEEGNQGLGVFAVVGLAGLNIFFMVLNLIFLNKCFRYFDPIHIIPLERTSNLMCNILCGGVIFKEFQFYTWARTSIIFVGCGFCIIGAIIFMNKKDEELQEKDFMRDEILSQASFSTMSSASVKEIITLK